MTATTACERCGHPFVHTPQTAPSERLSNLIAAARAIVDSFTAPDGSFIEDTLSRDEYDQLKAALEERDE